MLELCRRLHHEGKRIRVLAIDDSWESPQAVARAKSRDQIMADNLLRIRAASPQAILIALAGNVHTRVSKGSPWNDKYIPMGWIVSQSVKDVASLNVESSGGSAWVITDQGMGVTSMGGRDQGTSPFVTIDDNSDSAYHGALYIGPMTAAKPALIQDEEFGKDGN